MSAGFEHELLGDNLLEEEGSTANNKGMQRDAHNIYSSPDIISMIGSRRWILKGNFLYKTERKMSLRKS